LTANVCSITFLRVTVGLAAVEVSVAQVRLAMELAEVDRVRGWEADGIRSIGQWASVELGLDAARCRELTHVGHALHDLPAVREAAGAGRLSYDKLRLLARAATPELQGEWLYLASHASVTQLSRIVSAYRQAASSDTEPPTAAERRSRRSLLFAPDDDGLIRMTAVLEPEEAALVRAAVEVHREALFRDGCADVTDVDGLVALAETGLAAGPQVADADDRTHVVVHLDARLLAGDDQTGRCGVDGFGAVDLDTARRLACDASVCPLLVDGLDRPLGIGRTRRTVPRRLRRALRARDHGCAFPGCAATRYVDAHHIIHWADGGETSLENLVLLCRHHHRLHHEGGFSVERDGPRLRFRRRDGTEIGGRPPVPCGRVRTAPPPDVDGTALAAAAGGDPRYDLDLTVTALLAAEMRRAPEAVRSGVLWGA
jgi:hypothetical protein